MLPSMMGNSLGSAQGPGFGWNDVTAYEAGLHVDLARRLLARRAVLPEIRSALACVLFCVANPGGSPRRVGTTLQGTAPKP